MWVYGRASTFQSQIAGFDLATGLWIACNLQSNTIVIILEQINFHEYPQISNLTLFFRHWGSNSPVFINFILWNSRSTYMWSFKNVCRVYPGGSQSQPSSPQYASPDSWKTSPQQLQTEPQPIRYHPDRQNFGVFFQDFPQNRFTVVMFWRSDVPRFFSLWQLKITPKTKYWRWVLWNQKCGNKLTQVVYWISNRTDREGSWLMRITFFVKSVVFFHFLNSKGNSAAFSQPGSQGFIPLARVIYDGFMISRKSNTKQNARRELLFLGILLIWG